MAKPDASKLSSNYMITELFAESLNVHKCLSDIHACDLSDMTKVIDAYIQRQEGEENPDKAHIAIVQAFNTLSNNIQYRALAEYTSELAVYYVNNKVRFIDLFIQRLQRPFVSRKRSGTSGSLVRRISRTKRTRIESDTSSSSSFYQPPSSARPHEATEPVNDQDLTPVKETIRATAKKIHIALSEGKKIKFAEYKLMSTGLSSIIDLIDHNEDSQRQVFEDNHWNRFSKSVQDSYPSNQYHLSKFLKDTWNLVSVYCKETGSTMKAQRYLKGIINPKNSDNKKPETLKIISIFLFILETFEESKWLFDRSREKSENDFFSVLWGPLVRKMLSINNNIIDLKCDETIDPHIQFMQKIQVQEAENIKNTTVNLKFVLNFNNKEVEVGRMNVHGASSNKTELQVAEGNLLLKSKDLLDAVLNKLKDIYEAKSVQGTCIQVSGLVGHVFSVKLHQSQIYVGLPNATLNMLSSLASFSSFSDTFEQLMTSIIKMENLANTIIKSHTLFKERDMFSRQFNRTDTETQSIHLDRYLAPSWYPFQEADSSDDEHESPSGEDSELQLFSQVFAEYDKNLVDQYGWVKLRNRKYYNVETHVIQSAHPFSKTIL